MTAKVLPVLVLLLFANGCCKSAPPTRYICLLDISASIYPDAVREEFDAMDKLTERLNRGDSLVIIPIAGNARNDVQGHIVRLQVPEQRMAFDSDLASFRQDASRQIADMRDWAVDHPTARTDILGSLLVAQQELAPPGFNNSKLIILSDFLEDDGKWNFATDRAVASPAQAKRFAIFLDPHYPFSCRSLYLGLIRSRDSNLLSVSRLKSVDTFWQDLLCSTNDRTVIRGDGIGSL